MNLKQSITQVVSKSMVQQLDKELRQAITAILGDDWTFDEVGKRCTCTLHTDGREAYFLDEVPILEAWPVHTYVAADEFHSTLHAKRDFKRLYKETKRLAAAEGEKDE